MHHSVQRYTSARYRIYQVETERRANGILATYSKEVKVKEYGYFLYTQFTAATTTTTRILLFGFSRFLVQLQLCTKLKSTGIFFFSLMLYDNFFSLSMDGGRRNFVFVLLCMCCMRFFNVDCHMVSVQFSIFYLVAFANTRIHKWKNV